MQNRDAETRQPTHSWKRRSSQPKSRVLLLRTHKRLWNQPNTITTSLPLGTPQFTTWCTHAEYLMIILTDPTPPMYSLQSPSVPSPFSVTPTVTSSHSRCHGTQLTSPLILTCYRRIFGLQGRTYVRLGQQQNLASFGCYPTARVHKTANEKSDASLGCEGDFYTHAANTLTPTNTYTHNTRRHTFAHVRTPARTYNTHTYTNTHANTQVHKTIL